MNMRSSEYELHVGSLEKRCIVDHLTECDPAFVPALSTYVDINDYADRLAKNALAFSFWRAGRLVALLAAYFNRVEEGVVFISNLSVVPDQQGSGLASDLLLKVGERATMSGFMRIELEVFVGNKRAVSFYERHGFAVDRIKEERFRLIKHLNGPYPASE